jgi:plasmid stability protein
VLRVVPVERLVVRRRRPGMAAGFLSSGDDRGPAVPRGSCVAPGRIAECPAGNAVRPAAGVDARPAAHADHMRLHVQHMYGGAVPKMLQVRHVPDELHAVLRERAAESGLSLSEYVLRQLQAVAARPSKAQVLARAARRGGRLPFDAAVAAVDAGREGRT